MVESNGRIAIDVQLPEGGHASGVKVFICGESCEKRVRNLK